MPSQPNRKKTYPYLRQKSHKLVQIAAGTSPEGPPVYQVDLRKDGRYFLDDSLLFSPFGLRLPAALADLLDVAGSVMLADRYYRRSHRRGHYGRFRGWERKYNLVLGVRQPELWNRLEVRNALEDLLIWLTEDHWKLTFEQQIEMRRHSDIQQSLFPTPPSDALIVLYSGGLDSLAGAVSLLRSSNRPIVLASAVHDRLRGVIYRQVTELRKRFGNDRVHYAPLPFQAADKSEPVKNEEHTQRSRGFLFLSFGAAAAIACNASEIVICENGIGSLNLPMNWRQLGTQNTRATHPQTLVLMMRLLESLGLPSLQIEAPNLFRTKAEMCKELSSYGLGNLARLTVSCDSFPFRITHDPNDTELHCGRCTSCLLRRQALFASHLETISTGNYYRFDVCKKPNGVRLSNLEHLKNMLDQRYCIEMALASADPEQALFQCFPELITAYYALADFPAAFGLMDGENIVQKLCDILGKYAQEWSEFPYQLFPS